MEKNTSHDRSNSRNIRRRKNQAKKRFFVVCLILLLVLGTLAVLLLLPDKDETNEPQSSSNATSQNNLTNNSSFEDVYYYESGNLDRYEAYKKENPNMTTEDVVWKVNASLDKKVYIDNRELNGKDTLDDLLILVNKYNKLPETFTPQNLTDVGGGIQMRKEAAEAFKKMKNDAQAENIEFIPQSGYRSFDYQNSLYENYKASDPEGADTYSARPGFSEHQTGLAIDINIPSGGSLRNFNGTEQSEWINNNAHKYGYIVRYKESNKDVTGYISEPWHIRYLGVEHATKMHDLKIDSYEEYKVKYIDHSR